MRTLLLAIATTALIGGQVAPALAQATADERQDRSQIVRDDSGMRSDTAHIRQLNTQRRTLELRLKHDRGAARAADEKELARINGEEAAARKGEAALNANNHQELNDYHQDLSHQHPH